MLSVSVTERKREILIWSAITVFCALFSAVYEYFSFGVYSAHMIFLFAYPLLFGLLPTVFLRANMGRAWNDGVLLMTAASLLTGVFEIYGTTSPWPIWLWAAGAALMILRLAAGRLRALNPGA